MSQDARPWDGEDSKVTWKPTHSTRKSAGFISSEKNKRRLSGRIKMENRFILTLSVVKDYRSLEMAGLYFSDDKPPEVALRFCQEKLLPDSSLQGSRGNSLKLISQNSVSHPDVK